MSCTYADVGWQLVLALRFPLQTSLRCGGQSGEGAGRRRKEVC